MVADFKSEYPAGFRRNPHQDIQDAHCLGRKPDNAAVTSFRSYGFERNTPLSGKSAALSL